MSHNHISIMAAATAYYTMLSIFPAMAAGVLTYGLVADPATIEHLVKELAGVLPTEALTLLDSQLHRLVTATPEKLGIGLIASLLITVWSATSGTAALMEALTVAYEGTEDRGFLRFYGVAIGLTIALGLFGIAALLLIAGVPAAVSLLPLPDLWRKLLPLMRWPLLFVLAILGLGALYRTAPSGESGGWHFLRVGTLAASLLWLGGSAAFSFYAEHFGSYDRIYGSLGAVAIMLVWLYASAYIILAGAELNGVIDRDQDNAPPREVQPSSTGGLNT